MRKPVINEIEDRYSVDMEEIIFNLDGQRNEDRDKIFPKLLMIRFSADRGGGS